MTRRERGRVVPRAVLGAAAALLALALSPARAGELNVGATRAGGDAPMVFRITGKSRKDVIGGAIILGEARYTIQRVSQRGLIGASRRHDAGEDSFAEYAVFSSSFSAQTAVGDPWVAANRYHHCDVPYNSFLAVYRLNGEQAVQGLGSVPYPTLLRELDRSDDATVYCFMSSKGAGESSAP